MNEGDIFLIGLDRKKHPELLWKAYNNPPNQKFTKNLLHRINNELGGNINVDNFCYYCSYSPKSGRGTSYLISLKE